MDRKPDDTINLPLSPATCNQALWVTVVVFPSGFFPHSFLYDPRPLTGPFASHNVTMDMPWSVTFVEWRAYEESFTPSHWPEPAIQILGQCNQPSHVPLLPFLFHLFHDLLHVSWIFWSANLTPNTPSASNINLPTSISFKHSWLAIPLHS